MFHMVSFLLRLSLQWYEPLMRGNHAKSTVDFSTTHTPEYRASVLIVELDTCTYALDFWSIRRIFMEEFDTLLRD
jgi:hypothetical protein